MSFDISSPVLLSDATLSFDAALEACDTFPEVSRYTQKQPEGSLKTKTQEYIFSKQDPLSSESLKSTTSHTHLARSQPQTSAKITVLFHQVFVSPAKPALHTLLFPIQMGGKTENLTPGQKQLPVQEKHTSSHPSSLHSSPSFVSRAPVLTTHKTLSSEPVKNREQSDKETHAKNRLSSRSWSKCETLSFWETRYHQREREKEREGQHQHQGEHEQKDKKQQKEKIAVSGVKKSLSTSCEGSKEKRIPPKRPQLEPPKVGIFALYYILTKMGIASDGTSNFAYKKEIEVIESQTAETHKKRLEEMKIAMEKEKAAARWGIALKIFSWIGSFIAMIAGVALIVTGVGAVAGAMLIVAGLIQITSQLLEITGTWQKIALALPGDNPEKKRAVVMWMQMGIAILCLILSGVSIIWGGFSTFGEAMSTAMGLIGGIAAVGQGVTTIGGGISGFMYKERISEVKRAELRITQLKHKRQDLMELVEGGLDRLEKLFEDLSRLLDFEVELSRADQSINRR